MNKSISKDKIAHKWGVQFGDGGLMVDLRQLLMIELDLFEENIRESEREKKVPQLRKRAELVATSNGLDSNYKHKFGVNPNPSSNRLNKLGKLLDKFQADNPTITTSAVQNYILQRNLKT